MKYIQILSWFKLSKIKIICLLLLSAVTVIFEGFSVGLLIPFISSVDNSIQNISPKIDYFSTFNRFLEPFGISLDLQNFFIIIFILVSLRQLFSFLKDYYTEWFQAQGLENIRNKALKLLFNSSLEIFIHKKHGEFANLVFQATSVSSVMINVSIRILFNYFLIILYLALMLILSYQVTILIILIAFFFQIWMKRLNTISQKIGLRLKEFSQKIFNEIIEYSKNIKYVKLTSAENIVTKEIGKQFLNLKNNTKSHALLRSSVNSLSPLILIIAFGSTILFFHISLQLHIASFGLIGGMLFRLQQSITQINSDKISFSNSIESYKYLEEFFISAKEKKSKMIKGKKAFVFKKQIRFSNVNFKYDNTEEKYVLKNISLVIKKNLVTGIIGPSGSGKSTIIEILIGNYNINNGSIKIDECNLESFDFKNFKNSIGYVSQENIIFNESVLFNLLFGLQSKVSEQEIWKALDFVNLKREIERLPNKLNYKLGESGYKLSGGQRQRLCLARALISKPKILILDEPTSSLDTETEKIIKNNILILKKKLTIILISHSEQVIDLCDEIYTIRNGILKFYNK